MGRHVSRAAPKRIVGDVGGSDARSVALLSQGAAVSDGGESGVTV